MKSNIVIEYVDNSSEDWRQVLELLLAAFAYQRYRIDPPSSLYKLDEKSIVQKAKDEQLILAKDNDEVVGCVFVNDTNDIMYLGKLAVWPHLQGCGIGSELMQATENLAIEKGHRALELETRIELVENHDAFSKLGFVKVLEGTHEGYAKPTFIKMRKRLCI